MCVCMLFQELYTAQQVNAVYIRKTGLFVSLKVGIVIFELAMIFALHFYKYEH